MIPYGQCDQRYSTEVSLKRHIRYVHSGVQYPCSLCKKTFITQHIKIVHQDQKYKCPNISSYHEAVRHPCGHCDKWFTHKGYLKEHNLIFICSEIYRSKTGLNRLLLSYNQKIRLPFRERGQRTIGSSQTKYSQSEWDVKNDSKIGL